MENRLGIARGPGCGNREGSDTALKRKDEGSCGGGAAVYLDCINFTIPVMICTIVFQNVITGGN